jgi:hypothetical protein
VLRRAAFVCTLWGGDLRMNPSALACTSLLVVLGPLAFGCSSSSTTTTTTDSGPAETATDGTPSDGSDESGDVADTNKGDVLGTCTACRDANCKAESVACAADDACKARVTCLNGCTDAACQKACAEANPGAVADAYIGCLKDKCTAECTK